jgi:hypothetical protein
MADSGQSSGRILAGSGEAPGGCQCDDQNDEMSLCGECGKEL